jgi:hypothetical protein
MIVSERFVNRHAVPSRAGSQIATELQEQHPNRIWLPLNL